jgi:hypothetical protein
MIYTQYIKAENAKGGIETLTHECHAISDLDAYNKMRDFCDAEQLYIMDYDTEVTDEPSDHE